jgi:hypothetical protein
MIDKFAVWFLGLFGWKAGMLYLTESDHLERLTYIVFGGKNGTYNAAVLRGNKGSYSEAKAEASIRNHIREEYGIELAEVKFS